MGRKQEHDSGDGTRRDGSRAFRAVWARRIGDNHFPFVRAIEADPGTIEGETAGLKWRE